MRILQTFLATAFLPGAILFLNPASAHAVDPIQTFDVVASRLVDDPARHRIYASLRDSNAIAVIDTDMLAITKTISIGSAPVGMSISPDGTKLYVALTGATSIGVINLDTLTTLPTIPIETKPFEVEAGLDNRLYITPLSFGLTLQVDGTTGAKQAELESTYYDLLLQISPDRKTLYLADAGLSPSSVRRYEVSTATPSLLEASLFGTTGSNGEDLALSHSGKLLCFPNGGGNGAGYSTDLISADHFSTVYGTFGIGAYPGPLAFNPSDSVAVEIRFGFPLNLYFFNTSTYLEIESFELPYNGFTDALDVVCDGGGHYVLVADTEAIRVFDTLTTTSISALATVGEDFSFPLPILANPTSIETTGLPAGLAFDEESGTVTGTPMQDGTFDIVVIAKDAEHISSATLALTLYPNSRSQNISTRLSVQTDDNVLIAGFIIQGEEASPEKEVVLRAIGPSLAGAGLPADTLLSDPTLELRDASGNLLDSNDNWQDDAVSSALLLSHHLDPADPAESGLVVSLPPGAYTMILRGANGGTGIGLAEVFDIDPDANALQINAPRLGNISTRGNVQTLDNVMIGGFIVSGQAESNMLVRAIGPSLAAFGVPNPLADPRLDLYDRNGIVIASDDNWRDEQEAEIEGTGLAPSHDLESAISIALAPGAYTAIVRGADDATGVGLIEAYNLP